MADALTAARRPSVGDKVGEEYEILHEFEHGNTAKDRVFLAQNLVVLKFPSTENVARFDREYGIRAQLDHPNIPKVLGRWKFEGRAYMVQSFAGYADLYIVLKDHLLRREDARRVFAQVAAAVEYVHAKGIVHRDIKPANLCLRTTAERGVVVQLIDFNASKQDTSPPITKEDARPPKTELYCSPEQHHSGKSIFIDSRADLWAIAVVLYEMLTSSRQLIQHFTNREFDSAARDLRRSAAEKVRGFESFFAKAFHEKVERRFQTIREMRDAAEACFAKDARASTDGDRESLDELVRRCERRMEARIKQAVGRIHAQNLEGTGLAAGEVELQQAIGQRGRGEPRVRLSWAGLAGVVVTAGFMGMAIGAGGSYARQVKEEVTGAVASGSATAETPIPESVPSAPQSAQSTSMSPPSPPSATVPLPLPPVQSSKTVGSKSAPKKPTLEECQKRLRKAHPKPECEIECPWRWDPESGRCVSKQ